MQNGIFWQFLAYCAGRRFGADHRLRSRRGSDGPQCIDFVWYLKKISLLAIAGYLAGAGVFWLMFH